MPFFTSKKILLAFLNNSSLKLAQFEPGTGGSRQIAVAEKTFAEETAKDSSVINLEKFSKEVSEMLAGKVEWKNVPVLLVIPEEKIFLKGFELDLGDLEKKQEFRKDFISEIPFLEEELIIKERAVGKILEFTAVSKKYIEDFQKPFFDASRKIIGAVSLPHALVSGLAPERSLLATFYDNDFVLILSQNACILFSETERLVKTEMKKQILSAVDGFLWHPYSKDIKDATIILDPDIPEEVLKDKLEKLGYKVAVLKQMPVFLSAADYYFKNREEKQKWDLLSFGKERIWDRVLKNKKYFWYAGLALFISGLIGGAIWYFRFINLNNNQPISETASDAEPAIATASPAAEIPVLPVPEPAKPITKEDFPIKIFNGTFVAGEAGKLSAILKNKGFYVNSTGNYDDQNQIRTIIFASNEIPEEITSELRGILENYYKEVIISDSPVLIKDIHIVIGRKK